MNRLPLPLLPVFLTAVACVTLAVPAPSRAGAGPRDGTWSEQPPPDVREPLLSFVDPADGGLTVVMGYSGRAFQRFDLAGDGGWSVQSIEGGTPAMNVSFGLVPDLARRRLLAVGMDFAGYASGTFGEVELWALSLDPPRRWERIATTGLGPAERFRALCALDAETATLYVVGGVVDSHTDSTYSRVDFGDTWRIDLDGDLHWEPFPLVGEPLPGVLFGGMFFAPGERRLVVVAAHDTLGGPQYDRRVHALDVDGTRAWSELPPVPPELPRYNAALGVWDPLDDRLLVIEGPPDSMSQWRLDPAGAGAWSRVDYPTGGTLPAINPAQLALDAAGRRLVAFGGFVSHPEGPSVSHTDVWTGVLDGSLSWQRHYESVSGRSARWIVPPVLDAQRRRVVAVSGYNTALFSYALDGPQAWTVIVTQGPGPTPWRGGVLCLFDPPGDRLFVYGGRDERFFGGAEGDSIFHDLWELSFAFSPPRWRRIPDSAEAPRRYSGAAVHDPARRRFLLFGGVADEAMNDTWELDVRNADPTWRRIVTRGIPPPARWDHAAVHDTRRDGMIVYAGKAGSPASPVYLQDAWLLSFREGDAWVPLRPDNAPPSGRAASAAFYDPAEDRMVVLGGANAGGARFDFHALELAAGTPHWSDFLAQGIVPPATDGATALYDAEFDRVYLLGEDRPVGDMFRVLDWDRPAGASPPPSDTGASIRILGVGPNPSSGDVNIAFEVSRPTTVETRLYDVRGRMVRDLGRTVYQPGPHVLLWDGRAASGERLRDGVYFARIVVEGKAISGKIVLMD